MVLASSPWDIGFSSHASCANSSLGLVFNVLNMVSATSWTTGAASLSSTILSKLGEESLRTLLNSGRGSLEGSSFNYPSRLGGQVPGVRLTHCTKVLALDRQKLTLQMLQQTILCYPLFMHHLLSRVGLLPTFTFKDTNYYHRDVMYTCSAVSQNRASHRYICDILSKLRQRTHQIKLKTTW